LRGEARAAPGKLGELWSCCGQRTEFPGGYRFAVAALSRGCRVRDLGPRVGLSPRRFRDHFSAAVGCPPKQFSRIERLQRALALRNASSAWAAVALVAGYFDQAHLVHKFCELTGLRPSDYRPRDDGPNHVPFIRERGAVLFFQDSLVLKGEARSMTNSSLITLSPKLIVSDADSAIRFYIQAFGAHEIEQLSDGDQVVHSSLSLGSSFFSVVDFTPTIGSSLPGDNSPVICARRGRSRRSRLGRANTWRRDFDPGRGPPVWPTRRPHPRPLWSPVDLRSASTIGLSNLLEVGLECYAARLVPNSDPAFEPQDELKTQELRHEGLPRRPPFQRVSPCRVAAPSLPGTALARSGLGDFHHPAPP